MNAAELLAWADNETPCGRCGHAAGSHMPGPKFTECIHLSGWPDSCECPALMEPIGG